MDRKENIAIVGCAGVPCNYGGFETLAHQLVLDFKSDYNTTVYCSKHNYKAEERIKTWEGANLIYLPFKANGIQSIIYDIVSLIHAILYADKIIVLGVPGAMIFPFLKLFSSKKIITNIDGLEWKRDKWNKHAKSFLKWSEKVAVKYSDEVVADNQAIKDYVFKEYNTNANLIEYGADQVSKIDVKKSDFEKYPFLKSDYAFTVCRIEPENNIEMILEAFKSCPDKKYIIVGNWNYSEYSKNLRTKFQEFNNIEMLNPIYNRTVLDLLRTNCTTYIHGHSAGGTNPSLVEAMYAGLSIIAYDVSYNKMTTENETSYFNSSEELIQTIQSVSDKELKSISKKMKSIAERRYTWKVISSKYKELLHEESRNLKAVIA